MKAEYKPIITKEELPLIKKGDVIERMLGFSIACYLTVAEVTENTIQAGTLEGGWIFSRHTGIEIDDEIPFAVSYIRRALTEEQKEIVKQKGSLDDI